MPSLLPPGVDLTLTFTVVWTLSPTEIVVVVAGGRTTGVAVTAVASGE